MICAGQAIWHPHDTTAMRTSAHSATASHSAKIHSFVFQSSPQSDRIGTIDTQDGDCRATLRRPSLQFCSCPAKVFVPQIPAGIEKPAKKSSLRIKPG